MRKLFLTIMMSATIVFGSGAHADRQERATAAYEHAKAIIGQYISVNDNQILFDADRTIELAWRELTHYYGLDNELARDLALIRAKSASSRNDKGRVTRAWKTALNLQPDNLTAGQRLSLNIQAANATAKAGDVISSKQYFASARTYAFLKDRSAKQLQLHLRLQELRALGAQMEWRRLRDNLMDMRTFSEGFSLWTIPRLEALVSEAEIRLMYEPETQDKRLTLADLKSKIELVMKGVGQVLSPTYVNRVRDFYYTLEDNYDL